MPKEEERADYSTGNFEPFVIIAGFIGLGYLVTKISVAISNARHGGAIIDTRGDVLEIKSNPAVPYGSIVVVSTEKTELLQKPTSEKIETAIKAISPGT